VIDPGGGAKQVDQNWDLWLHIHQLEREFPRLRPLSPGDFETVLYQRAEHEIGVNQVATAILGSPLTLAEFAPGHGITTMFRAVRTTLASAFESSRRLQIAVDLANYDADSLFETLWENIHQDIFRELVSNNWHARLYGQRRQAFQKLFDVTGYATFPDYINAMQRSVDEDGVGLSTLKSFRYEASVESLVKLFSALFEQLAVETLFMVDIPSDADEETILPLMSEIKAFSDRVAFNKGFPPAAWSEAYFGTADALNTVQGTWERDYHRVVVPPYNPAELYAILTKHYRSKRDDSLIAILSAYYLDDVWSASEPMTHIMDELRRSLRQRLDCPRDQVSYGMFQDPPGQR
jgi:hypothetical protein